MLFIIYCTSPPLVSGVSPRRSGFDSRAVRVVFMVEKIALEHSFLPLLLISLVYYSIDAPCLFIHLLTIDANISLASRSVLNKTFKRNVFVAAVRPIALKRKQQYVQLL